MTRKAGFYTLLGYAIILIWGTCFVFIRELVSLAGNNAFSAVFAINLLAALAALLCGAAAGERKRFGRVYAKKPGRFIKLLCFNGFYHVLMPLSTYLVLQVQYATIANYTWPMLLVYFSYRHQGRRLPGRVMASCLLGFTSVVIVAAPGSLELASGNILGVACALTGALFWAAYSAELDESIHGIRLLFQGLAQSVAALSSLIVGLGVGYFSGNTFSLAWLCSMKIIPLFLYVSLVVTVFTYVAWIQVMVRHPDPDRFKISVYLLPVINVVAATVWYRTSIQANIWIALALVLTGIWLSKTKNNK